MLFGIGGGNLKVDVVSVNHDFTFKKKKERKNQCLVHWFVCQVHWVTHVRNFFESSPTLVSMSQRCLIHIVALLNCLSGAKACVNIYRVH